MENYNKKKEAYYDILKVLTDRGSIANVIIIKYYDEMSKAYSELTMEELQIADLLPNIKLNSTNNNKDGDCEESEKKKLAIIEECIRKMNEDLQKIESENNENHQDDTIVTNSNGEQINNITMTAEENKWKNYFNCIMQ